MAVGIMNGPVYGQIEVTKFVGKDNAHFKSISTPIASLPLSTDGHTVGTAATLTITTNVHSYVPLVLSPNLALWPHGNWVSYEEIRKEVVEKVPPEVQYMNTAFVVHTAAHIIQKETEEALESAAVLSEKPNPCPNRDAVHLLVRDHDLATMLHDMDKVMSEMVMLRCLDSLRFLADAIEEHYPNISPMRWLSPPHLPIAQHPIAAALFKMDLEAMDALLALGVDIHTQDALGATLLHSFASGGSKAQVTALLARHANALMRDVYHNTALHNAVTSNNMATLVPLLEHLHATHILPLVLGQQNLQELVPLTIATFNQCIPALESLLPYHHLSKHYDHYESGNLSLNDWLVSHEVEEAIWQLLIDHDLPINRKNSEDYTALDTAIALGKPSIATFLATHGGFRNAEISPMDIHLHFHLQVMHSVCQHTLVMGFLQEHFVAIIAPNMLLALTKSIYAQLSFFIPSNTITESLQRLVQQYVGEEQVKTFFTLLITAIAAPGETVATWLVGSSDPNALSDNQTYARDFLQECLDQLLEMASESIMGASCKRFLPVIDDHPGHRLTNSEVENWLQNHASVAMVPVAAQCPSGYETIANLTLQGEVPGLALEVERPLRVCERTILWSTNACFEQYPAILTTAGIALVATQTVGKIMLSKKETDALAVLTMGGVGAAIGVCYVVQTVYPYIIPSIHKAPGFLKEPHEQLMAALEKWKLAEAQEKLAKTARHEASGLGVKGEERERLLANVEIAQKNANQAEGDLQNAKDHMVNLCEKIRSQIQDNTNLFLAYEDLLICSKYHLEHDAVKEAALVHKTFRWEFDNYILENALPQDTRIDDAEDR